MIPAERTGELPPHDVPLLKRNPDVAVTSYPNTTRTIIYPNLKRKPLDDVRIRQAMMYAIDRESIVANVLLGMGRVAYSPFASFTPWYEAVFKQLNTQFQRLRDVKAQSMIDELSKTIHLAKTDLDEATSALAPTEKRLGSDLAELRSMQDMASSDRALRRCSGEDIRAASADCAASERRSASCWLYWPRSRTIPAGWRPCRKPLAGVASRMRRLKDGLIDAQFCARPRLWELCLPNIPACGPPRSRRRKSAGNCTTS